MSHYGLTLVVSVSCWMLLTGGFALRNGATAALVAVPQRAVKEAGNSGPAPAQRVDGAARTAAAEKSKATNPRVPPPKPRSPRDGANAAGAESGATLDDAEPAKPLRRLPRYFAQLELDEDQRRQVDKIQQQYADRWQRLRQQLTALETERDAKLQELLSPAQQKRLKELQQPAVN